MNGQHAFFPEDTCGEIVLALLLKLHLTDLESCQFPLSHILDPLAVLAQQQETSDLLNLALRTHHEDAGRKIDIQWFLNNRSN